MTTDCNNTVETAEARPGSVQRFVMPIRPYYQDSLVTLYHGKCADIIPMLAEVDNVITDPPWKTGSLGIEMGHLKGVAKAREATKSLEYGSIGTWEADAMTAIVNATRYDCFIISGYKELEDNLKIAKPFRGVLVWHKPNGMLPLVYPAKMDVAFIVWCAKESQLYGRQIFPSSVLSHSMPVAGCMATERLTENGGKASHPCQGPESLYKQLIAPLPPSNIILDPYAGSGTTLRAAKDLERRAIGIEMNEKYCELIAQRLAQDVLPLNGHNAQDQRPRADSGTLKTQSAKESQ
jgi:site-specific DNA-methyltransferase (adenine-specific)